MQRAAGFAQRGQLICLVILDDHFFLLAACIMFDNRAMVLLVTTKFWPGRLELAANARHAVADGVAKNILVTVLAEIFFAVTPAARIAQQALAIDMLDKRSNIRVTVMAIIVPGLSRQHNRFLLPCPASKFRDPTVR